MKTPAKRWFSLGFSLLLVGSLGASYYVHSRDKEDYQTAPVDRGDIKSTISATGTCNAVVTVQVGSQVSGNIKELYADFNTKVKKGQLVALIDPEIFQARVSQARAALDSSKAAVVNAQAMVQKSEADIATAKANVENEKANVAKAKVEALDAKAKLDRRLEMFTQGILSREDRDTAQAAYDSAVQAQRAVEAQLSAAEHNVAAAESQHQVALTQLASAQAQVKQAEANLEQAQVDLEHTEIRAPVDGTVVARRMDVGQTVAASFQAPTIFEIAQDLTKMQVDTNVDEADIGRVSVGQPATFTVDAYPGTVFSGVVSQIRKAPINTQNVITYDVVVTVNNPDLKLYPGMTANVRILTGEARNVLRVPNAALRFHPVEARSSRPLPGAPVPTVYKLDQSGKAQPVHVKTGVTDGIYTEVLSGDLHEGDSVVVASLSKGSPKPAAPRRGPSF